MRYLPDVDNIGRKYLVRAKVLNSSIVNQNVPFRFQEDKISKFVTGLYNETYGKEICWYLQSLEPFDFQEKIVLLHKFSNFGYNIDISIDKEEPDER